MILVITQMKVLSEKRMELSQTIASLFGSIRMEKGFQPNSQIEINVGAIRCKQRKAWAASSLPAIIAI
jgi:hypothetical protein